ncbi:MAG: epoxyqueuosine reductase [Thermodesulfobacteriota bacterium]
MGDDLQSWLVAVVNDFVRDSPENRFSGGFDEKAFEDVLVGFASGSDPIFESYKELVGEDHWTPAEIFGITYPESAVKPEQLTVISWILPQREATKADNRQETTYPGPRWVQARFAGEDFNDALRNHVVTTLAAKGIKAVAPVKTPGFAWHKSEKYLWSSTWSERHMAYAAGLGTFGLCDGLITPKGKAHRAGSVVAGAVLPPSPRPYTDHHAYCLFYQDGSCRQCADRCPVGAISEHGHDKSACWDHTCETCKDFIEKHYGFKGYGCGLCQTDVPCESGIPGKVRGMEIT